MAQIYEHLMKRPYSEFQWKLDTSVADIFGPPRPIAICCTFGHLFDPMLISSGRLFDSPFLKADFKIRCHMTWVS